MMMNCNDTVLEQINDPTDDLEKVTKDSKINNSCISVTCCICLLSYSKVTIERSGKQTEVFVEKNTKINSEFQEDCEDGVSSKSSSFLSIDDCLDASVKTDTSNYCIDEEEGLMNRRFFALHSCGHMMCTSCLASYCASKVIERIIEIKCCHISEKSQQIQLDASSPEQSSDAQLICKKVIVEEDILFLLNRFDSENRASRAQLKSVSGTSLIDRYERFKFDLKHGETLRRCPDCDHPHIFDMVDMRQDRTVKVPSIENKSNVHTNEEKKHPNQLKKEKKLLREQTIVATEKKPSENDFSDYQVDIKYYSESEENNILPISQEDMICIPVTKDNKKQGKSPKNPIVNCEKCNSVFCYYHSNAHVGKTCEQYETDIKESEEKTREYLEQAGSKQCPSCGAFVLKDGGCNHMKCVNCDTCFCWLCLTIVEDTTFPAHFQWWNIGGCPNMQMRDGEEPTPRAMMWTRFISFIQMVIIGPPTLVLSTITMIFCYSCCYCCVNVVGNSNRERFSNIISFWGCLISGIMLLGFTLSVGIAFSAAFIVLAFFIGFFLGPWLESNSGSSDETNSTDETSKVSDVTTENITTDNETSNVSNLELTSSNNNFLKEPTVE